MGIARRGGFCLLLLSLAGLRSPAQTVMPIISEYTGQADGSFQVRNETLTPFAVVLEPRSFSVTLQGDPVYRSLDPDVTVTLSTKSFRVPPHRAYTVFYKARSQKLPAWFTIYSDIQAKPTSPGVQVVIRLPHTVYLLTKDEPRRSDVVVSQGVFSPATRQVTFTIENKSESFGRVETVELRSLAGRQSYGGFPCFPRQRRLVMLDWKNPIPPNSVEIAFPKFKFEVPFPDFLPGP